MTCIKAISVSINFMITATTSISLDTVNHITTNMESKTIVKVVTVLTLAIVNPREFRCTATSSLITQEPLFSKTNSSVALTHILWSNKAERNNNRKTAEGFHRRYLTNMNNPGSAKYPRCAKAVSKKTRVL